MGFLGKDKLLLLDLRAQSAVVKGSELEALGVTRHCPGLDEEVQLGKGASGCCSDAGLLETGLQLLGWFLVTSGSSCRAGPAEGVLS